MPVPAKSTILTSQSTPATMFVPTSASRMSEISQTKESEVANYVLTIVAATALIGNLILVGLHIGRKRMRPRVEKIMWTVIFIDLSHILLAVSLLFVLLSRDVLSRMLCDMGGHLLLFGLQACLWCSFIQTLLIINCLSWRLRLYKNKNIGRVMFGAVLVALCIADAIVSFLPLSKNNYFKKITVYSYRCVVMQRTDSVGHEYSLLLLSLNWLVLVLLSVLLIYVGIRKHRGNNEPQLPDKIQDNVSVRLCGLWVDGCLLLVNQVLLTALVLAPRTTSSTTSALRWLYLYQTALLPAGHILQALARELRARHRRRHGLLSDNSGGIAAMQLLSPTAVPDNLLEIQIMAGGNKQMTSTHEYPAHANAFAGGVFNFKVSWADRPEATGSTTSTGQMGNSRTNVHTGCLRAYAGRVKHKWKWEVKAAVKLTNYSHPNVTRYLWISKRNTFQAALACVCPEKLDPRSRLICRQHYPLGNLRTFLLRRRNRITEGTLHLVALDVASGLSHLNHLNLLHNALCTDTVYVKNCLDTSIVKVVLADFEISQELAEPSVKINGIPQQLQLQGYGQITGGLSHRTGLLEALRSNMFAADVRSFALLLLEMLLVYVQRQQEQRKRHNRVSSGFFSGGSGGAGSKLNTSLGDIARRRAQLDCAASRSTLVSDTSSSVFCMSEPPLSEQSTRLSSCVGADELYEQIRLSRTANLTPIRSKRNLRKSVSSSTLQPSKSAASPTVGRAGTPESVLEVTEEEAASMPVGTMVEPDSTSQRQHIYQNLQAASFRIQGVFTSDTELQSLPPPPPPRHSSYTDSLGYGVVQTSESESSSGEAGHLIRPAADVPSRSLHYIKEDEAQCSSGRSSAAPPSSAGRPDIIKTVSGGRSTPQPVSSLEEAPLDTPRLFGLNQHHVTICQRLLSEYPRWFEYAAMLGAEKSRVRLMLAGLENSGLQVLANNLVQMVDIAWFTEPCVSADSLLEQLQHVLPGGTGSVISSV